MAKITDVTAYPHKASGDKDTLGVVIGSDGNARNIASVPAGTSTGIWEAPTYENVRDSIDAVNGAIRNRILGMPIDTLADIREIDNAMARLVDSAGNPLCARATTGVSRAVIRAGAETKGVEIFRFLNPYATTYVLPVPFFNICNGGKHGPGGPSVQEFMIGPVGAKTFTEAYNIGKGVFRSFEHVLKKKYGDNLQKGAEGGFILPAGDTETALDLIVEALRATPFYDKVILALDVAASSFYDEKTGLYMLDGREMNSGQLNDYYEFLCKKYPRLRSIEDGFWEEDFAGFAEQRRRLGETIQVVGDDLLVTNLTRLERGIAENACTALLLKDNQNGLVTGALDAAEMAMQAGWDVMGSHRSRETLDTFLSDLVVAIGCGQIKTGAPFKKVRDAKYRRICDIEEMLGERAIYAGAFWRRYGSERRLTTMFDTAPNGIGTPLHMQAHVGGNSRKAPKNGDKLSQ